MGQLMQNLQSGYGLASAPTPGAAANYYGMPGLLGTAGVPMAQMPGPVAMRTPDYTQLLGQFGQQPLNYAGGMFMPPEAAMIPQFQQPQMPSAGQVPVTPPPTAPEYGSIGGGGCDIFGNCGGANLQAYGGGE